MRLFISYSHLDRDAASEICRLCDVHGIAYFRDEKDLKWGDSIREGVGRGLAECTHILVILSPATTKSWWVPFELGRAVERGLVILPYLTHPALELPSLLTDTLWVCGLEQLRVALRTLCDPRRGSLDAETVPPELLEAAYRAYSVVFFGGDDATQQEVSAQVLEAYAGEPPPASVVRLHQHQCLKDRRLYRGEEFLDIAPQLLKNEEVDGATKDDYLCWLGQIAKGLSR